MKKTKYLHIGIIITGSLLSSCNDMNIGGNQNSPVDSLKTKAAADSLAIAEIEATDESILDSINQSNYFTSIEGTYQSNETKTVEYAGGPVPSEYPYVVLTIKSENDKFIVEEVYDGDVPYGCGGPNTEATAEIVRIDKTNKDIFSINLKKINCHFTDGAGCEFDREFTEEIIESNPKKNQNFTITFDRKNDNSIIMTSNALKSKCKHAWNFKGMTFRKINLTSYSQ
jgi:hypothetical protein